MAQLNTIRPSKTAETNSINFRRAIIAAVVSSMITLVIIILMSLLISLSVLPEEIIPAFSVIITLAGSFLAGYLTVLSVRSYGLFNGIAAGVFFFVISFVASSVAAPGLAITRKFFINLLLSVIGGGAGGIVCINAGASRRAGKRRRKRYSRR